LYVQAGSIRDQSEEVVIELPNFIFGVMLTSDIIRVIVQQNKRKKTPRLSRTFWVVSGTMISEGSTTPPISGTTLNFFDSQRRNPDM